jgi:hypothetical protein
VFRKLTHTAVLAAMVAGLVTVIASPAGATGSNPQSLADYNSLMAQVNSMASQYTASATGQPGPSPDPEAMIALVPSSVL